MTLIYLCVTLADGEIGNYLPLLTIVGLLPSEVVLIRVS